MVPFCSESCRLSQSNLGSGGRATPPQSPHKGVNSCLSEPLRADNIDNDGKAPISICSSPTKAIAVGIGRRAAARSDPVGANGGVPAPARVGGVAVCVAAHVSLSVAPRGVAHDGAIPARSAGVGAEAVQVVGACVRGGHVGVRPEVGVAELLGLRVTAAGDGAVRVGEEVRGRLGDVGRQVGLDPRRRQRRGRLVRSQPTLLCRGALLCSYWSRADLADMADSRRSGARPREDSRPSTLNMWALSFLSSCFSNIFNWVVE